VISTSAPPGGRRVTLHLGRQGLGDRELMHAEHRSARRPMGRFAGGLSSRTTRHVDVGPLCPCRRPIYGSQGCAIRYPVNWNSTAVRTVAWTVDAGTAAAEPPRNGREWHASFSLMTTRGPSSGTRRARGRRACRLDGTTTAQALDAVHGGPRRGRAGGHARRRDGRVRPGAHARPSVPRAAPNHAQPVDETISERDLATQDRDDGWMPVARFMEKPVAPEVLVYEVDHLLRRRTER